MKRRFTTSSRRARVKTRAPGVTLIEALAGLVILGTLLVSITIARGRFIRQRALAEQKIAAAQGAERLISRWLASAGTAAIPANSQGPLEGISNHTWRTHIVPDTAAADLGAS